MKSAEKNLRDLEKIYALALNNENYSVALKAKELLAKAQGLFKQKPKTALSLKNLTTDELEQLLAQVELRLGEDLLSSDS